MAVVWTPTSAWSSLIGFTALAWTTFILFASTGLRSTLPFVAGYRPWMYLGAAILFTTVHTIAMPLIWDSYY